MAQENPQTANNGTNNSQPTFGIDKIYIKDLSIEVPGAPQVFQARETPEIAITLSNTANQINEAIWEVSLTATIKANLPDGTPLFLVEVTQSGTFVVQNIPEQELQPLLAVFIPNILYPYVRETISDAITRAGFQPVLLSPFDFEGHYRRQVEEQLAQQGQQ